MNDAMNYQEILFDIDDGIATITLNDPQTRNALSLEMRAELRHAIGAIKESAGETVKAVILTGAGDAFCAGGNVKNMGGGAATGPAGRSRMRKSHELIYDILHLEVPVVSLVDGPAAGAGCNLALLADFVLATPRGYFMQAFARIGLVPDWGGFFVLPRLVGLQRAKELIYSGRRVYAEEAKDLGMILDVVDQDNAMAEARELAGRFCHASTAAIGVSKNILNQSFNQDFRSLMEMEAMGQSLVRDTDFHREAVRRFKDKDTPLYDWEALVK
ncbi:MAG: enoyl-CoA hydratase/isomerase family protein [Alphaproteobacteria bacterium]|nr:enoyl-CoA hydratase/isomerase family protein [Alphaproteobacteria bacterium]